MTPAEALTPSHAAAESDASVGGPRLAFTRTLEMTPLRAAITSANRRAEPESIPRLLELARLTPAQARSAHVLAARIAGKLRDASTSSGQAGLVQGLLQEFALSSQEGVALMCLAEALLRIPDAATRDALIRDKIGGGDWRAHVGGSPSLFVNAATWGLLLTGKLVATHSAAGLGEALRRSIARGGEPLIRTAVDFGMRMMGEQFVIGETIEDALNRAAAREARGFSYSYDILGEAALTAQEAEHYVAAYDHAIHVIGAVSARRGVYDGPGISLKLSALHPRYSRAQIERVHAELYPRLLHLARLAREYDIGFNIDAEECSRLEISLELLERLCFEPSLAGWNGIGFVVQSYQKRCLPVVDFLIDLARRSRRRLMIRLVKGAYWDAEIKRAQLDGLDGFPVFTRKAYSDVAYLACARKLLTAPQEIYPQFATHNAHTLAAVHALAGPAAAPHLLEFQCLHGMGEPLYDQVIGDAGEGGLGRRCRIYAPVGRHDTLLAYLVRRLLENGSNTSFINRVANDEIPIEALVEDPVVTVERMAASEGVLGLPHPAIAAPPDLFGSRANSRGIDFTDERHLASLSGACAANSRTQWRAAPMLAVPATPEEPHSVLNPADRRDVVGEVRNASSADVEVALAHAASFAPMWAAWSPAARASALERAADRLDADTERLVVLLAREAGKTAPNAVAEVREAVDFLRYYAAQVRAEFDNETHVPLGPVVCISPWNFPLAIFIGQVAAALAAGNTVLAKPAEQTSLIAAQAVQALWDAGVPKAAVQLVPGPGRVVGMTLVGDPRVQGVLFTGSTEVARQLHGVLAQRLGPADEPIPLIAETGGQNAMVVDSSALPEQVVADVLSSAFDSAGQRCSALRVLCVQRELGDRLMQVLTGAMRELRVGDPRELAVDVGPVIDARARAAIEEHVAAMRAKGRNVIRPLAVGEDVAERGSYVVPTVIELESIAELDREVFGPVLHVIRYERDEIEALFEAINATGYGLTLGVHTRIDETVVRVATQVRAGNVYVNRNMVGAIVGSQPFGGEGLSGTGPKAGGPLYLLRLLSERPADAAVRAVQRSGTDARAPVRALPVIQGAPASDPALRVLKNWLAARGHSALAVQCSRLAECSPTNYWRALPGPTGEANLYAVFARHAVLCVAEADEDRLAQLAAVLAAGSRAIWPATAHALLARLPEEVRERVVLAEDWTHDAVEFDAALHHGSAESLRALLAQLAARPGSIGGVAAMSPGVLEIPVERLVVERAISINTAAAGGNASLMSIG